MQDVIDPQKFGVSFSVKQCRDFGVPWQDCLAWSLAQGFQRFRLMSYWDELEKQQGIYDFTALDTQIEMIGKAGGKISLCLGVKQPRWPEYHWPQWMHDVSAEQKTEALINFVKHVVNRYKNNPAVTSWQLENEALLSNFGNNIQIDRKRLQAEYQLVKSLDDRPIIMSTSNGWGLPTRQPIPDIVGFSYYGMMHNNGQYRRTIHRPWLYKTRKYLVNQLLGKPTFIHELQLEPWGPKAIWEMTIAEQDKSMGIQHIAKNLAAAKKIKAYPIDLWGLEWWYWRQQQGDPTIWQAIKTTIG